MDSDPEQNDKILSDFAFLCVSRAASYLVRLFEAQKLQFRPTFLKTTVLVLKFEKSKFTGFIKVREVYFLNLFFLVSLAKPLTVCSRFRQSLEKNFLKT
jgi:hypothetical protein